MRYLIILLMLSACSDKLYEINHSVNQEPYVLGKHDCRSYVEEKAQELMKNGYKSEQILVVITSYKNQPHVVLNVDNWILDNNYSNPYPAPLKMRKGMTYETWSKWNSPT